MEWITTNATGTVREDKMEGRDYYVVPMVMMVEGVLNGSAGPIYYPANEIAKLPQVWNHKPVVVYHPTMNGQALSACDPDIISTYKIGVIMNTTFDGKRLKAEAWVEKDRVGEVDDRVLEAIQNNKMMELSTGLFTENEMAEGEFNGKEYISIARNIRPDHLAVLPDQIGACSIADGAGFLRVNAENKGEVTSLLASLGVNEKSHSEIHRELSRMLDEKIPSTEGSYFYIEEVFDDWFVYEKEGKYYAQKWGKDANKKLTFVGLPKIVMRSWVNEDGSPVMNSKEEKGEATMSKEKMVDNIIANTAWTEEDREYLMEQNEDHLKKMVPVVNDAPPVEKKPEPETKAQAPVDNEKPVTLQEFIGNAPAEIREVLEDSLQTHVARKDALIATITANAKNTFTKDALSAMKVSDLQAIANLAQKEEDKKAMVANYGGMAPVGNAADEEPLEAPVMNFGSDA